MLDSVRLPGVTNGTWSLRVKIEDPEKPIPSYIHRRDEGELWSLNFEGRVFRCWKCGSPTHIGDKCREQNKTFEEIFSETGDDSLAKPTWAAVVRSGNVDTLDDHRKRVRELEQRLTAEHLKKTKELQRQRLELEVKEAEEEKQRQITLAGVESAAKIAVGSPSSEERDVGIMSDQDKVSDQNNVSDSDLLSAVTSSEVQTNVPSFSSISLRFSETLQAGLRAHRHLELTKNVPPPELGLLFGESSKMLAVEYKGDMRGQGGYAARREFEDTKVVSASQQHSSTKTDSCEMGLKGRKRQNPSKEVDKETNDLLSVMYATDADSTSSESSSITSLEAKKLRLEEILWEEALVDQSDLGNSSASVGGEIDSPPLTNLCENEMSDKLDLGKFPPLRDSSGLKGSSSVSSVKRGAKKLCNCCFFLTVA